MMRGDDVHAHREAVLSRASVMKRNAACAEHHLSRPGEVRGSEVARDNRHAASLEAPFRPRNFSRQSAAALTSHRPRRFNPHR